jgi:hypothetical protein
VGHDDDHDDDDDDDYEHLKKSGVVEYIPPMHCLLPQPSATTFVQIATIGATHAASATHEKRVLAPDGVGVFAQHTSPMLQSFPPRQHPPVRSQFSAVSHCAPMPT